MPYTLDTLGRYARPAAGRGEQLDGFTDVLRRVAGDVVGVVQQVESGAQQVQRVARQVEAQAPNVQAILREPRAAYGGAAGGARASEASGGHPFLLAIGAGLFVAGIVHLVRSR